ncbi:helix-turn-helix domain-containing protein [Streptomonospora nanhaiensis]|uniref:helix-turn-helix domain-containing protein n=1 Tax=Streptomonospora nanhaiensis TaxID=1323731 RepID=UPI001C390177|nr:helix-turn-helix domain-containing protein [Streptomonospora nanhaiensis]MBV2364244.1 helix-turn-helix domain-containing protein [Streptomonospora nanhaiensis]
MDTTTAAQTAGVTVTTIRHWARMGAVAATKAGRRWIIDGASLARRIALGIRRTAKKKVYTLENMLAIGGNRWQRGDKDRVYFNNIEELLGLDIDRYNTGNISYAAVDGHPVSNSEARRILAAVDKVYFDNTTGKAHIQWGYGSPRTMHRTEMAERIFGSLRARVAAL